MLGSCTIVWRSGNFYGSVMSCYTHRSQNWRKRLSGERDCMCQPVGAMDAKFWKTEIFMENARSWPLSGLQSLRGPRWREFHCLAARQLSFYMTRRALCLSSNTVTGVIGPVHGKHRFYKIGVFNRELLEICKFVWSRRIFPIVFSHVAFVWRRQIAK